MKKSGGVHRFDMFLGLCVLAFVAVVFVWKQEFA